MPASNRNLGLDLLRLLMAVMVVGLHTNWLCAISPHWNQLTVNGLFRVAVPVFFIINGYYAFDVFQADRLRIWLARILRIYLFWAIVYLPAYWPQSGSSNTALLAFVANLLMGYWHLWYMVALAAGGVSLWMLRTLSAKRLLCIAIGLFISGMALEIAKLGAGIPMLVRIYRSFLFDALPFLLVGYVARRDGILISSPVLWISAAVGLAGLLLESLADHSFAVSRTAPDIYLSLIILCPSIFLLALRSPFMTSGDGYAKASSAIYFSHLGFMLLGQSIGILPGLRLFSFVLVVSALACWPIVMISKRWRLSFVL